MKHDGVPIPRQFLGFVALLLALSFAAAGCGKTHPVATSPTTLSNRSTSTTVPPAGVAILQGYRDFQAAYFAAGDPMNPSDPRLAQHATGQELARIRSAFLAHKAAGQVFRGTIDLAPRVVSVSGSNATVEDCYFDHGQVYDLKTGVPQGTLDTQRQLVDVTMQLENGIWKAADEDHKGEGCSPAS